MRGRAVSAMECQVCKDERSLVRSVDNSVLNYQCLVYSQLDDEGEIYLETNIYIRMKTTMT